MHKKKKTIRKFDKGGQASRLPWDRISSDEIEFRKKLQAAYEEDPASKASGRKYSAEHGVEYKTVYPGQTKPLPSQETDEDTLGIFTNGKRKTLNQKRQDKAVEQGVDYLTKYLPQSLHPLVNMAEKSMLRKAAKEGLSPKDLKNKFDVEYQQSKHATSDADSDDSFIEIKKFKKGGAIKMKSASARADGIAKKGKTRGKIY